MNGRRFPFYGWLGLAVMLASEALMLIKVEPFYSWHTPIAWSGWIAFADAAVYWRSGRSWMHDWPLEFFCFLAPLSIALWLVFEAYNLLIQNWHYINLPQSLPARYFGYAWSFATIWPAIFETADLLDAYGIFEGRLARPVAIGRPARVVIALAGLAMLLVPIMYPSRYLAAPVWLGFILFLDPINTASGGASLVGDAAHGSIRRLLNLAAAGLICGVLWEFWNYWANARWIYSVPILPRTKIFEMPLLGYFGFPPFALECFAMYETARLLLWRGMPRRSGISAARPKRRLEAHPPNTRRSIG